MTARREVILWVAVCFAAGGCGSSTDRFLVGDVTDIPSTAGELQVRVVIANHIGVAEYFALPTPSRSKESFALQIPKDRNGHYELEVIARDKAHCEVAGLRQRGFYSAESTGETKLAFPLQPIPLSVCDLARTPSMSVIPTGNYVIGCDATDPACTTDEGPSRTLAFPQFEIDGNEVTIGAYDDCRVAKACSAPLAATETPDRKDDGARNGVTWDQAKTFCEWMGKRLPTEGEWEAAARGGTAHTYPWGDAEPTCDLSSFYNNGVGCLPSLPADPLSIGLRPAGRSPTGLYDMAGNVSEWVADYAAPRSQLTDEETIRGGPANGRYRIFKGGDVASAPQFVRVAHRAALLPDGSAPDTGQGQVFPEESLPLLGFRCALSR